MHLERVTRPEDLRGLTEAELDELAAEIRDFVIDAVSGTGGHLGSNLGVVELSIALHRVFESPRDAILWDTGHQAYIHKILTGRNDELHTIRTKDGLAPFLRRDESEYDTFGAGHAATSISAAWGMATARDLNDDDFKVAAIIGDGAMGCGLAYEALNNAGHTERDFIVVLNDNGMSIAKPQGALAAYFDRIRINPAYRKVKRKARDVMGHLPGAGLIGEVYHRLGEIAKDAIAEDAWFEKFGLLTVGPIDGHNMEHLIPVLKNVRDDQAEGPVLVHVVTQKGKGYDPAEQSVDKYHGVGKFNVVTGALDTGTHVWFSAR